MGRIWSQPRRGEGEGDGDQAAAAAADRRQDRAHRRHTAALGLHRPDQEGLAGELADAARWAMPTPRRRSTRRSWSTSSPSPGRWHREGRAMFPPIPNPTTEPVPPQFGEADLWRRSASSIERPAERQTEVAKLIDVSKCIGCKACQAACLEWNEMREEIGTNHRGLREPAGSDADSLTLMRYHRVGEPGDRQPRVADPQGRLHALRGSGLPQGLPGAGRDRAVLQRHRRLRARELHRLRLLREGLPVQHPAALQGHRPQGLQVHALLRPRRGRPGAGLRQGLPDPGDRLRHQGRDEGAGRAAHRRPEVARLRRTPGSTIRRASAART